jgi:hypothetical protein
MGNLWGFIESPRWLGIWWIVRHALYAGLTILIVFLVPSSVIFIASIFLLAHIYKFGRFVIQSSYEEKERRNHNLNRTTTLNEKRENPDIGDVEVGTSDEMNEATCHIK